MKNIDNEAFGSKSPQASRKKLFSGEQHNSLQDHLKQKNQNSLKK